MKKPSATRHPGPDLATRAGAAISAAVFLLLASSALGSDRPRTVVVLAGPGEAERTEELREALAAHLIDTGFEPRVLTVERRPSCPPDPDDTSHERYLAADVASLVWLSDAGDRFCTLTPEIDGRVDDRALPDSGEGWASRSDVAASMVYSELEPLVRRDEDAERERDAEPTRFGLAARAGLDVPTADLGPFLVAALEVDLFLPVPNRRLALALDLSFTRPGHSGRGSDPRIGGEYTYELHVLELKAGLDVVVRLADDGATVIPLVGLGPVCQFLHTTQTTSITGGENTEWTFEPGFEVLVGLDVPLGPGYLLFDFRYVFSDLDHRFTGDTNAGNVTTAIGYRVVF